MNGSSHYRHTLALRGRRALGIGCVCWKAGPLLFNKPIVNYQMRMTRGKCGAALGGSWLLCQLRRHPHSQVRYHTPLWSRTCKIEAGGPWTKANVCCVVNPPSLRVSGWRRHTALVLFLLFPSDFRKVLPLELPLPIWKVMWRWIFIVSLVEFRITSVTNL